MSAVVAVFLVLGFVIAACAGALFVLGMTGSWISRDDEGGGS